MGVGYRNCSKSCRFNLDVSIAGAILGGGLHHSARNICIEYVVSIAGAILGGGLLSNTDAKLSKS